MVIDLGAGPCIPSCVAELAWDKCLASTLACCWLVVALNLNYSLAEAVHYCLYVALVPTLLAALVVDCYLTEIDYLKVFDLWAKGIG